MKLEDILPAHCHALARRLLAEVRAVREEMGRSEDARPVPEISGAEPREVYFEAIGAWRKASRLAAELGVQSPLAAPASPDVRTIKPGHVLQLLEAVLERVGDVKRRLGVTENADQPAIETHRQPSDVLVTVIRINRELSRALERPFTPSDVYATVALASAYAARLGASTQLAPFERRRQPTHCYGRLDACLSRANAAIAKRGGQTLVSRGAPPDVTPGDVYDVANLVLGELAYLHALTPNAAPLHAFEPQPTGHFLPAHVDQLARTLEAQLASLA